MYAIIYQASIGDKNILRDSHNIYGYYCYLEIPGLFIKTVWRPNYSMEDNEFINTDNGIKPVFNVLLLKALINVLFCKYSDI